MSTARRPLGTGPATTPATATASTPARLLPVERAAVADQEHADPRTGSAGGSVPGRRTLGDRAL